MIEPASAPGDAESTSGAPPQVGAPTLSAGAMLRQARVAQGLHIAALAASIKMPQRKLEAVEADRYADLPDAAFTRALAQTMCRALKIDPAPVLARLPRPDTTRLERTARGLDRPFHDDRERSRVSSDFGLLRRPIVWGPALILLAAAALFALPPDLLRPRPAPTDPAASQPAPISPPPGGAPAAPAAAPAATETVHSAPAPTAIAPDTTAQGVLVIRTSAEAWVEVVDARSQVLLARNLQAAEAIGLSGAPPFRLRLGNVAATRIQFRGQPIELVPRKDNTLTLQLE